MHSSLSDIFRWGYIFSLQLRPFTGWCGFRAYDGRWEPRMDKQRCRYCTSASKWKDTTQVSGRPIFLYSFWFTAEQFSFITWKLLRTFGSSVSEINGWIACLQLCFGNWEKTCSTLSSSTAHISRPGICCGWPYCSIWENLSCSWKGCGELAMVSRLPPIWTVL